MTIDEAAARLERLKAGETYAKVYRTEKCLGGWMEADKDKIVDWALPLLDETPADIPWLNDISREGGDMSFMHVRLMENGKIHLMAPGKSTEGIEGLRDFVSPIPATRGAVRMLCHALGVQLREPAPGK